MNEERSRLFFSFLIEEAIRNMDEDIEKYILLVDFKNAKMANISYKQMKQLAPILQV